LTDGDVAHFRREGYLLFHQPVFLPAELGALYQILQEQLDSKGDQLSDELDTPHFREPRLLDFLLSDRVLDLVEPIIGPDIALWSSHFIVKDAYVGRATPWHEDSAFWKSRLSEYSSIVTVWLALDPVWSGNGCMQVVAGSHLEGGFSDYAAVDGATNTFTREISNELDASRMVKFELSPGEASLHDGRIIHGAGPNTSAVRRAGFTMRYISTAAHIIPEANPGHKVWLARGHDRAGNVYENVRTEAPSTE